MAYLPRLELGWSLYVFINCKRGRDRRWNIKTPSSYRLHTTFHCCSLELSVCELYPWRHSFNWSQRTHDFLYIWYSARAKINIRATISQSPMKGSRWVKALTPHFSSHRPISCNYKSDRLLLQRFIYFLMFFSFICMVLWMSFMCHKKTVTISHKGQK